MTSKKLFGEAFLRLPTSVQRTALHALGRYAPWEEKFDFSPPVLRLDETAGPPDFVGVGVQKAGTSWWHALIVAHPGVTHRGDIHKERHFLAQFGDRPFDQAAIDDYHGWFPRVRGSISGEWTPDYLWYPWLPEILYRAAPETRLLVLLRDPVERFRSGVAHQIRNGAKHTPAVVAEAMDRGFYARLLSAWDRYYEQGKLLVLQYENCVIATDCELARTYRFLELDDSFRPQNRERRVNSTSGSIAIDDEVRERLIDMYFPDVMLLAKRFPEIDLSLWPNFAGA